MTIAKWLLVVILGLASCSVLAVGAPDAAAVEQEQRARLAEARARLKTGDTEAALAILDRMLEHYAAVYPEGDTRWYVARSQSETLAYLITEAAQHDRGIATSPSSRVVYVSWADALFHKAYALVEQGNMPEAERALAKAIRLTPQNSLYLAELGHIHQMAKDWDAALLAFEAAEEAVSFSPEAQRTSDSGRAKRGIAYSLIELGRWDEARFKLEEALELDPGDASARGSLEYVRQAKSRIARDPAAE